jgi:hypothetical protein
VVCFNTLHLPKELLFWMGSGSSGSRTPAERHPIPRSAQEPAMLVYTRYPDYDFTWFVLKSDVPIAKWLATIQQYSREGMTRFELYDLRARDASFTTEEIQSIVQQTLQHGPLRPARAKTAIVVNETLKFGLVRMYESFAALEGITTETRPFYDLTEAVGWLGKGIDQIPGLLPPAP